MQIGKYLLSRFTSLVPPLVLPENPIKLLRMLNRRQTALFIVALLAWTFDAFDFFSVTLNITNIAETYGKTASDITWGITVTLMLRSVGAIIFGVAGDQFGRKWPFIVNVVFYAIVEICTGFCNTYEQFLGVRVLFGIAMGGVYGNCAATALEDAPMAVRGLLSGMLQQGYALGYLLAAAFNLAITPNQSHETETFTRVKAERVAKALENKKDSKVSSVRAFLSGIRPALAEHWATLIYLVLMMAGFNFLSHGSQDLYPTFLSSQLGFSPTYVTVTTVVANCGAILGGSVVGYFSNCFGRRLSILAVLIIGAALIPAYTLPRTKSIMAGAFFEQLCVQGAWGVVPIHLMELAPVNFRSFVVGTSYQLGNLISSASSTIEATVGEKFPLSTSSSSSTHKQYDYGKVIALFLGATYAYLLIIIFLGPEKRNMEQEKVTKIEVAENEIDVTKIEVTEKEIEVTKIEVTENGIQVTPISTKKVEAF
ncbi:unnamed protein product [Adineta ricciae]|uniref:Major facilitator superfamily (MFS) profile domain-containing protein n=1 Tax=Adineta ricciae TaxID=249248 RepID=A0A815PMU9_ADIRI|nr:unnamed protein product [Adineta ricciae]CAF1632770.1 unnamed protein product [Adineta ricciae]